MKRLSYPLVIILTILLSTPNFLIAQSTFDEVYTILQTNCAVSGCHDATASGNMDLSGTKQDVYAALVGVTPDNSVAAFNGFKRITPGYPRRSFLMRKINNGLDTYNDIGAGEGDAMPQTGGHLSNIDIEMVRQWILFGAPDTGQVVDPQLISDYYTTGGLAKIPPVAPPTSNGFQAQVGPFFMAPHTEVEYSIKQELFNPQPIEVIRLEADMNEESHHYAMFKYFPDKDTLMRAGLRKVNSIADAAGVFYNSTIIAEWANSMNLELPAGTAFFWEANAVLDLNYHLINTSDSILPAQVYLNVYTQPSGIAQVEMKAAPVYYGGENVAALVIPNTGDTTFTMLQFDPDSSYNWYLWMIMAHTHAYGRDFDVWLRNPDGSKGDHIYNGRYNENYTVLQGYFDWEHPPVRFFDPLQEVNMTNGLIHEARFTNNGPDTIHFGLTTQDEMFVSYLLYTEELPTGIRDLGGIQNGAVKIYPHPFSGTTNFEVSTTDASPLQLQVFDLLGREVDEVGEIETTTFKYNSGNLKPGVYIYRINQGNGLIGTGKLVIN